jgi:hypothetical protein
MAVRGGGNDHRIVADAEGRGEMGRAAGEQRDGQSLEETGRLSLSPL